MARQGVLNPKFICKRRPELAIPTFEWGGIFEQWARGFVRRNFWRVASIFMTEEDALQECAVVFVVCRNKYTGLIREAKHMMALYKTALTRAWHSFAVRDPHYRTELSETIEITEIDYNHGPLATLLTQVDGELRAAIVAIINAPDEFLSMIFEGGNTKQITRRLSRMFRIKAGERDLITELRDLLADGLT